LILYLLGFDSQLFVHKSLDRRPRRLPDRHQTVKDLYNCIREVRVRKMGVRI